MLATILIVAITCLLMILLVLFKPSINFKGISIGTYWVVVVIGAVALIVFNYIDINDVVAGLTADNSINPIKILVLFISMTILSIFLDEIGFFRYMANIALKYAGVSQLKLFFLLYAIVSVLTVFTSNDIIVLTFTPFICYFARHAKINPVPYLVAEFVAANTWSMLLIIGNPTNIYIATANGINFVEYAKLMAIPTICAGIVNLAVIYLLFRKKLKKLIEDPIIEVIKIKDKGLLIIGIIHLAVCTLLLVISSYLNIEMWLITLCFAVSLFVCVIIYKLIKKDKPRELLQCLKRAPWELIPFVISMFVLVLALEKQGVTVKMAELLNNDYSILSYGAASLIFSNLINNIPMSVLFSNILGSGATTGSVLATIAGSNIGAFLTPVGALAGIMWTGILKVHNAKFSFSDFVKYGTIIAIPTLLAAIGGIYLTTLIA